MFGSEDEKNEAVRSYAAGVMTFATLQRQGIENYLDVLARLGALGLRPPTAPLEEPNATMRERGRAIIAERIRDA